MQKTVYHILPRLKLRRIFPGAYFLITNHPEEKVQVFLSEKELSELQKTAEMFSRNQIWVTVWKGQIQNSAIVKTIS